MIETRVVKVSAKLSLSADNVAELEEKIASEEPRQVHELLAHQRKRMTAGESSDPPEPLGTPTGEAASRGGEQRSQEEPEPRGFRR